MQISSFYLQLNDQSLLFSKYKSHLLPLSSPLGHHYSHPTRDSFPPPSIFRSIIFLSQSLISHPSCHSSSTPPSLPPSPFPFPGALCRRCHNRRWNRFICSNVVWAAAWHGTERHFLPAHRKRFSLCLQFMCFQTGQSTPLSCAARSLSPPLSASHYLCSHTTLHSTQNLSQYHICLSSCSLIYRYFVRFFFTLELSKITNWLFPGVGKKDSLNLGVCLYSILMWQPQEHQADMWHLKLQWKQLWCEDMWAAPCCL